MARTFQNALKEAAAVVEATLDPVVHRSGVPPIQEAIMYAVKGGKTLRGFLVLEGAALHGVTKEAAAPAAAAIEAMHAYSLVHDDLPCMDDDDLRRGQPTVHRNGTKPPRFSQAMPCKRWHSNS